MAPLQSQTKIHSVCYCPLNFQVCENLSNGSYPEEQAAVQGVTATVEMYSVLIRQVHHYFTPLLINLFKVPLVIFALFVGPWSDNVGRKRLLLFPFAGYFLTCISFILNVYFFDELYVEFLWFENVSACFGAYIIFFIGAYGYMADVTSVESRYTVLLLFAVLIIFKFQNHQNVSP